MNLRKFALLGILIAGFLGLAACETITTATTLTTTQGITTTTQSDQEKVQAVIDALTLGDVSGITADITLPTPTTNGVTVTWASSDEDVINIFGEVTIPGYADGDATITLTATVRLGTVTLTKTFEVTVLAQTIEDYLIAAANSIIITGSDAITGNFVLPSSARGATVTWTSSDIVVAAIGATVNGDNYWPVTITRPKAEEGGVNTAVTLTATLTIGETSIQVTKTIFVIAEPPATVFTSFAALHEASSLNDYVDVTGIVYAKFSGGYFLVDTLGDYLAVYTTATNYNAVALGDSVRIKGLYKNYYTLFQISNLTYQEVLSHSNEYTIDPIVLDDPADLLAIPAADDRVIHGTTYTVTVMIKVLANGYVDIYKGTTRLGTVYSYSLTASLNALKANDGKIVTIDVIYYTLHPTNGVMVLFQGSASDIEVAQLEGQEALDADTAALAVTSPVVGGQAVTLPAAGTYGSAIAWAITAGDTYATIAAGKITFVDVVATQTVELTATLTLAGIETPTTKVFTITVNPITTSTIAQVRGMTVSAQLVQVEGIVFFFTDNSYYIADETGMLNIYTPAIAGMALGDRVVIVGTLAAYNNQIQLTGAIVKQTVSTGNDYEQDVVVYEPGVSPLVSGHTYTVTGTVQIKGTNNNVYIYDGETLLMAIYYHSTSNDSYNALKAQVGKQITFDAVYMYTGNDSNFAGANTIFFVYQEGADGLILPELTDVEKVASDKAGLSLSLEALSGGTATLPALGGYGSAIAWEVVSGGATLNAGVVTYPEVEANTDVVLRATLTLNAASDTKEFTVVVAPIVPLSVTEVYDKIIALGTAQASIVGSIEVFEGTIIGFKWKSGFTVYEGIYVTDGDSVMYIYTSSTATTAFAIGDVILVKGTLKTYYYLPEVDTVTVLQKVADGTPAEYAPLELTIADIYGYTATNTPYYSQQIVVTGTLVVGAGDSSTWLIDGDGHKLIFSRVVSDLTTLSALNGKEVVFTGFLNDYYNSYTAWRITGAGSTFVLSEAQKAADDVAGTVVKTSVISEEVLTLPTTAANGSTIAWALKGTPTHIVSLVDNVVTFANVTETSTDELTATFTYTPAVGDPIITTKDYTFTISTLEVKLAADKEALTVAATATELDVINLPTTGTNGSAITWALTATDDATLATNVLTLKYKGAAYSVTVTATLTLSIYTDTKEFTISVGTVTVLSCTEAYTYIRTLVGTGSVTGNIGYLKGTIIEFKTSNATNYGGAFVTDGTQVIYVYYSFPKADYAIGDVVLIKGTFKSYYYLPEIDTTTLRLVLEGETAAEYTPIAATIAEIAAYNSSTANTSPYLAQQLVVSGTIVKDGSTYFLSDGTNRLQFYYVEFSDGTVLADLVGAQVTLTAILGEYRSDGSIRLNGAYATIDITDADAVAFDKAKLPATLELTEDYVLPTAALAAFDISAISENLQPYLVESATGLTVTLPSDADVVGTVTVTVTLNAVSENVVIDVTVKAMTVAYKIGLIKAELVAAFEGKTYDIESTITLPVTDTLTFGSTIAWASDNAVVNVETGAIGTVESATAVVLTATITIGETSEPQTINITVKDLVETLAKEIGFESSETFTASTTYNNQTVVFTGATGSQWGTYFGTPSTTSPITGAQSLQMRYYTTTPTMYGYTYTNFAVADVTKVVFTAKNYASAADVTVSYSTDGGQTWTVAATFDLTTTATEYTADINASGDVMIKFTMANTAIAERVTIDTVKIYNLQ